MTIENPDRKEADFSQVNFAARQANADEYLAENSLLGRTWKAWRLCMVALALILAAGTVYLLSRGYRSGAPAFLPAADYMMCLLCSAGGAMGVGWSARSLFDEETTGFDRLHAWMAASTPLAALTAWAIGLMLLHAYLKGWQPQIPFLVCNPFGLLLTIYFIGLALFHLSVRLGHFVLQRA